MGLDAVVKCTCFQDGKTRDLPFPREFVVQHEEGGVVLAPAYNNEKYWFSFDAWLRTCCEHEDMDHTATRISNWTGYRLFQQALRCVGRENFPVLHAELPDSNGGLMSSAQSARALAELDAFLDHGVLGEKTVLIDTRHDEVLYQRVAAYDGVFIYSGSTGVNVGLDTSEIFVTDRQTGEELFRAQRLRLITPYGKPITAEGGVEAWENLDTGERYRTRLAITGKLIPWDDGQYRNANGDFRHGYPSEMHVEIRPWRTEEFQSIVDALKLVAAASAATGNPVIWC